MFMLLTAVFTLLICQHHEEGSAAAPLTGGLDRLGCAANHRGRNREHVDRQLSRRSRGSGRRLAVGLIGMKASEAVGRNPGAATPILVQSILAIAFAEAIVFYALFLVQ